jgi:hypothetical protein
MRVQAVMIAAAQGQVAAILRVLRRPPRTSRAAVWKSHSHSLKLLALHSDTNILGIIRLRPTPHVW